MTINLNTLLFFIGAIIGSILPDADCKGSKIGKKIPMWLVVRHKTITHSIFAIIIAGLITKFHLYLGYGLFIGVCSHILGDMFTVNGCPFFYPILKERQRFASIKVYSDTEFKIILILSAILITIIATMKF